MRLIAELGQTMHGDVFRAVDAVDAFAEAGATGIKVQLLDPNTIATGWATSYWRTDGNVGAINQREAFQSWGVIPHDEWGPVVERCGIRGVEFIGTPFDLAAVSALADYGADAIKIASGDITNEPLLRAAAKTNIPIILSTGASTLAEVREAVFRLRQGDPRCDITLLACTLSYPTSLLDANLARIHTLRTVINKVGYSDHTDDTVKIPFAAAVAGATLLEKHCQLRHSANPSGDEKFALTPERFKEYAKLALFGEQVAGNGEVGVTHAEQPARDGARRSVRWRRDYSAGVSPTWDNVTTLRPCVTAQEKHSWMHFSMALDRGWALKRDVIAGQPVLRSDFF